MKSPVAIAPVPFNKRFGGRDSAKTLFRWREDMIDRLTRDRYAELLRRFIAGQVTNFEYEDHFDDIAINLDIADPAVDELFRVMWFTYCDIRKHKMAGDHAFEGERRKTVLRFLLFLHSDCPYEWPTTKLSGCLLNLLTLGLYGKLKKPDPVITNGDEDVWPFYRKEDYEYAVRHPRLLDGRRHHAPAADAASPGAPSSPPSIQRS